MNQFDLDCLQRRNLARQARYKKNGSKSKKCSLPSDRLTQKQWKEKCGPVMNYNLGKPMDWVAFKNMPANIQVEYIKNLQEKFSSTATDLANMFGVKAQTVRRFAESKNLNVEFLRGHSMSQSQREEWNAFLSMTTQDNEQRINKDNSNGAQSKPDSLKMNMRRFSIRFDGSIDVNMIANSLRLILGESASGQVEIICDLI